MLRPFSLPGIVFALLLIAGCSQKEKLLREFSDSSQSLIRAYYTGDIAEAEKSMKELVHRADDLEKKYPNALEYAKIRWVAQLRLFRVLSYQHRDSDSEVAMSAAIHEFRCFDSKDPDAEDQKLHANFLEFLAAMEKDTRPIWMRSERP
jgi:hypothetical protein